MISMYTYYAYKRCVDVWSMLIYYLQGMYNHLKDDLEVQRDIALVMSLLADTVRTADDLLHQVTIDGYHVSKTLVPRLT